MVDQVTNLEGKRCRQILSVSNPAVEESGTGDVRHLTLLTNYFCINVFMTNVLNQVKSSQLSA